MRKLIESTFISLDGVVSDPQLWSTRYWDDEHAGYASRLLHNADSLLLGRHTYDGFAAAWPQRSGDDYTDRINALPKHVISRGRPELTWNATLLEGDLAGAVRELKQGEGGDLLKFGTGETDHVLLGEGLVDELHLWTFPVVVGSGTRLLEGMPTTHLPLRDLVHFRSGIVVLVFGSNPIPD